MTRKAAYARLEKKLTVDKTTILTQADVRLLTREVQRLLTSSMPGLSDDVHPLGRAFRRSHDKVHAHSRLSDDVFVSGAFLEFPWLPGYQSPNGIGHRLLGRSPAIGDPISEIVDVGRTVVSHARIIRETDQRYNRTRSRYAFVPASPTCLRDVDTRD